MRERRLEAPSSSTGSQLGLEAPEKRRRLQRSRGGSREEEEAEQLRGISKDTRAAVSEKVIVPEKPLNC